MVCVLLISAISTSARAVLAQTTYRVVSLLVTDELTQAALSGVHITAEGVRDRDWTTDAGGHANVVVPQATPIILLVRRPGYLPVRLSSLPQVDSTSIALAMRRIVQSLDTAVVLGDNRSRFLDEFEARRLRGGGSATFITRAQIDQRMATRTIDLVRGALGVRVVDSAGVLLLASSRTAKPSWAGGKNDLAPCVFRVAVDGMIREAGFSMDEIEPAEIHGIEIYPGPATVPSQYSGMRKDAGCGLVMIWSRRGP
jgi:hypothetical protein